MKTELNRSEDGGDDEGGRKCQRRWTRVTMKVDESVNEGERK